MTAVVHASVDIESVGYVPPVVDRRDMADVSSRVLDAIYKEDVNIVIWRRNLSESLHQCVQHFLVWQPTFKYAMAVSPGHVYDRLLEAFGSTDYVPLASNITALTEKFASVFGLPRVNLRLAVIRQTMCPRFHVDNVRCRLLSTYYGAATEWLAHDAVDRSKLGMVSRYLSDSESGVYQHEKDIQQLACGDVVLLKGEGWQGNEGAGLVHRSPDVANGDCRLLLTLDFVDESL